MKKKVIVLYGGQSTEHEISCRSAAFVLKNLDQSKYELGAIGVSESGEWLPQDPRRLLNELQEAPNKKLSIHCDSPHALNIDMGQVQDLLSVTASSQSQLREEVVFFPVIHGRGGEDGSLQGLFDLAGLAYVGPGTLGSSMSIDKVVAKQRVAQAGVKIVAYETIRYESWLRSGVQFAEQCVSSLGPRLFVKPATLGSSVGIRPAEGVTDCHKACAEAFEYDDKILVEARLDAREIECAALGGYEPEISLPGEVEAHSGFYSYEAKYGDPSASTIKVPTELSPAKSDEVRNLALKAFTALELYGMARIDFFLCKNSGEFYFNEANTIPGFTEISQYPALWKHSGLAEKELIDRLVELAWARKLHNDRLKRHMEQREN